MFDFFFSWQDSQVGESTPSVLHHFFCVEAMAPKKVVKMQNLLSKPKGSVGAEVPAAVAAAEVPAAVAAAEVPAAVAAAEVPATIPLPCDLSRREQSLMRLIGEMLEHNETRPKRPRTTTTSGSSGDIVVHVETMSASGVWTFHVNPTDGILRVKQMLAADSCYKVSKMLFFFAGEELSDERTCAEFAGKTLHMSVVKEPRDTHTPQSPSEVFLLQCYCRTTDTPLHLVTVAVIATDTIRIVKGKIAEAAGIPADNMTVWLDCERLGDNRMLYEYDVVDDSEFVIVTY
jgi:hypothetical protein